MSINLHNGFEGDYTIKPNRLRFEHVFVGMSYEGDDGETRAAEYPEKKDDGEHPDSSYWNRVPVNSNCLHVFHAVNASAGDTAVWALDGSVSAAHGTVSNPPVASGQWRAIEWVNSKGFSEPMWVSYDFTAGGTSHDYGLNVAPGNTNVDGWLYFQYKVGSGNWTTVTIHKNASGIFQNNMTNSKHFLDYGQNKENTLKIRFIMGVTTTTQSAWGLRNLRVFQIRSAPFRSALGGAFNLRQISTSGAPVTKHYKNFTG